MKKSFIDILDELINKGILIKEDATLNPWDKDTKSTMKYRLNSNSRVQLLFASSRKGEYLVAFYFPDREPPIRYHFNYYGIIPRLAFALNMPKDFNSLMHKHLGSKMKYLKRKGRFIKK